MTEDSPALLSAGPRSLTPALPDACCVTYHHPRTLEPLCSFGLGVSVSLGAGQAYDIVDIGECSGGTHQYAVSSQSSVAVFERLPFREEEKCHRAPSTPPLAKDRDREGPTPPLRWITDGETAGSTSYPSSRVCVIRKGDDADPSCPGNVFIARAAGSQPLPGGGGAFGSAARGHLVKLWDVAVDDRAVEPVATITVHGAMYGIFGFAHPGRGPQFVVASNFIHVIDLATQVETKRIPAHHGRASPLNPNNYELFAIAHVPSEGGSVEGSPIFYVGAHSAVSLLDLRVDLPEKIVSHIDAVGYTKSLCCTEKELVVLDGAGITVVDARKPSVSLAKTLPLHPGSGDLAHVGIVAVGERLRERYFYSSVQRGSEGLAHWRLKDGQVDVKKQISWNAEGVCLLDPGDGFVGRALVEAEAERVGFLFGVLVECCPVSVVLNDAGPLMAFRW